MRWQRIAQAAIALFIVAFIGVLIVSMRRQAAVQQTTQKPAPQLPPKATQVLPDGGVYVHYDGERKVFESKAGKYVAYQDGRIEMSNGVRLVTFRDGKELVVKAREADVKVRPDQQVDTAVFRKDVWLTTASGVDVKAEEATYTDADGMVKIPGAVAFRKGRMNGSGVGATYDRTREVLWILDKARIKVRAAKDGTGALDGESGSAGLARAEHYMRLTTNARVTGEGRRMEADEITITMTEDDERVQMTQLRGNSRITGGAGGPQSMTAKDIDLMYADDGRTLQNANLMENAAVQLPGPGRKRVAARILNIGLAPDGRTVTHLQGTENVQVDLPAEPKVPAKRIRASALQANGAPDTGLRSATFTGSVEYRETQSAARNVAAIDRTSTSDTLVIDTKPGLGAVEKADFRGNFTFKDAPDVEGEGPQAIYQVDRGRIDIVPGEGYPGKPPRVTDGKISVNARSVSVTLNGRELSADTKVRSTILAKQNRGRGEPAARTPSVMKQDEPVNVTANRLAYVGSTSKATYSGNVTMWQDTAKDEGATIKGDTLVIDDKTGNLEAQGNAITNFMLEETDAKTGQKKKTRTTGKADTFLYEDERRLATYTGKAQLDGAQGNLTAPRIQVTLKKEANEVERLEAWAQGGIVTLKESLRTVTGTHLTYTAANDTYLMIGTPVIVVEEEKGNCREAQGASLTFVRGAQARQWTLRGIGNTVMGDTKQVPCPSGMGK